MICHISNSAGRVESCGRLIEEEHRRAHDQAGGQIETASHAARVALEHAVGRIGELESSEQIGGASLGVAAVRPAQLADHDEVLPPGEQVIEGRVLCGHADRAPYRGCLRHDVVSGDPRVTAVGDREGRQDAHGGGLAGAVGAEHAQDGSGRHLQAYPGESLRFPVTLGEGLGLDHHCLCHLEPQVVGRLSYLPYGKQTTYRSSSMMKDVPRRTGSPSGRARPRLSPRRRVPEEPLEQPVSTRDRILDIAMDLFIEQGFDKTSLREIADQLGFSKAAIYYHFESKDEILLALHMRLHEIGRRAMERFGETPASLEAWAQAARRADR